MKTALKLFGLAVGVSAIVLTFYWYDFKLALIVLMLLWANNIDMGLNDNYNDK